MAQAISDIADKLLGKVWDYEKLGLLTNLEMSGSYFSGIVNLAI